MKPTNTTRWGEFLHSIRCMCAGLMLSAHFTPATPALIFIAVGVLTATGLITPLLRLLGWRNLAERIGDAATGPRANEVERALRVALNNGLVLTEAVRVLHQTRGWDVMELYPAVTKIAKVPLKDAVRLVMTATEPVSV